MSLYISTIDKHGLNSVALASSLLYTRYQSIMDAPHVDLLSCIIQARCVRGVFS
jgi:hypothetical protein